MNKVEETVAKARTAKSGPNTRLLKIIRRTHMFTGLFMLPWVLMYGLSAIVFNHANWFISNANQNQAATQLRETRNLPESFWTSTPLAEVESAQSLAQKFLQALNRESGTNTSGAWRLADEDEARFTRNLVLEGRDKSAPMELQMDLDERTGKVVWRGATTNRSQAKPEGYGDRRRFQPLGVFAFDENWLGGVGAECGKLEQTTNPAAIELRVKNAPDLLFAAEADGRTWIMRCNLTSGEMVARVAGPSGNIVSSTAGFMKNLHKAHGYPAGGKMGVRWWWAVIVDGMASLMLLWGLSGLAMWWQMKGQRKWGAVTLAACAFMGWLVWTGMQHALR